MAVNNCEWMWMVVTFNFFQFLLKKLTAFHFIIKSSWQPKSEQIVLPCRGWWNGQALVFRVLLEQYQRETLLETETVPHFPTVTKKTPVTASVDQSN